MKSPAFYRLLLRFYPESFRDAYGDAMARDAAALLARSRERRGHLGPLLLWPALVLDAIRGGLAERRSQPRPARDPRRPSMLETLLHDLRTAARGLRRSPGFTASVVATLALGIGANSAIFTVVNAVLLKPLPYAEPDRLMLLSETNPERGWKEAELSAANYLDWREQSKTFSGMAGYYDGVGQVALATESTAGAQGSEAPAMAKIMATAGDLFGVLGVPPALGRAFEEKETWSDDSKVAILSDSLWRTRFRGDRSVLGRKIFLSGVPVTVVGVMPAGFTFVFEDTDLWVPAGWERASRTLPRFRRAHGLRVVGRLAPSATLEGARRELSAIAARLEKQYPDTNTLMGAGARPLHDYLVGDTRRPLLLLHAAVALVLLIACANAAHLHLARSAARTREMAVRGCLGASRGRLIRQAFLESSLLAVAGGGFGLLIARFGIPALLAKVPKGLPRLSEISLDGSVLLFTAALAAVTVLLAGIAPALEGARTDLDAVLRSVVRGESRSRARTRDLLVALEVALAVTVLAGAALLVRSLDRLTRVNPGFDATNVVTARLSLPGTGYRDEAAVSAFTDRLLAEVRAVPGVESAGIVRALPLTGSGWTSDMAVEGRGREDFGIEISHREITPGYLATLRVPVLEGRDFGPADREGAPNVALVNEALARAYFPQGDAVGRRIAFDRYPDANSQWRTIVGVVGSERRVSLGVAPRPEVFAPLAQDMTRSFALVVRTPLGFEIAAAIKDRLSAIDPSIPLHQVRTLAEVRDVSLARERFLLTLFGLFGLLALFLSVLGVYGVTSHVAARR
ncbi:MAG: ABC transporter permease, partial [Acidobacteria bacterium]|nr:ABC transporter permease [Acidobacteriota bacterium]